MIVANCTIDVLVAPAILARYLYALKDRIIANFTIDVFVAPAMIVRFLRALKDRIIANFTIDVLVMPAIFVRSLRALKDRVVAIVEIDVLAAFCPLWRAELWVGLCQDRGDPFGGGLGGLVWRTMLCGGGSWFLGSSAYLKRY